MSTLPDRLSILVFKVDYVVESVSTFVFVIVSSTDTVERLLFVVETSVESKIERFEIAVFKLVVLLFIELFNSEETVSI